MAHSAPLWSLFGVWLVHLLAVVSPGPSFVAVSRAATRSRAAGIATGFGVATAVLFWAVAASLGLDLLLGRVPWLFRVLQVGGGLFLLWIGVQSWRHARDPLALVADAAPAPAQWRRAYGQGAMTSLANPKIIVFFGSIFLTLLPPGTPPWVCLAALAVVFANEAAWDTLVAFGFSSRPVQSRYRRAKVWVDRTMGSVMGGFGLRLVAGGLGRLGS